MQGEKLIAFDSTIAWINRFENGCFMYVSHCVQQFVEAPHMQQNNE